jgi:uncharacterized protein
MAQEEPILITDRSVPPEWFPHIQSAFNWLHFANVYVVGSYARGEATQKSDLDLLVEYTTQIPSLLDLGGALIDLQESLGIKVEIVTQKYLSLNVRTHMMQHAKLVIVNGKHLA